MQQNSSARERIVASAKRLFAERGFHRMSVADLADDAKVSVGAIYRSFASKSEIIRAIVQSDTENTLGQLQTDIDQVREGTIAGPAAIERMIHEWISKRSDALNHEIVAEAHRNPEVGEVLTTVCSQFRELFRLLARNVQPELDAQEIEGVAELLLACLFGMGNREFTRPHLDERDTATVVAKLVLRAMKVEDAPPSQP